MSVLKDKILINTGADTKFAKMKALLEPKGAIVYNLPMIRTQPAKMDRKQQKILGNITKFDWIIFTSTNAVRYFFYWLDKQNIQYSKVHLNTAAIGRATADELKKYDINVDYIGTAKDSKQFAKDFLNDVTSCGKRILLPVGNLAEKHLYNTLKEVHIIEKITLYNTLEPISMNSEIIDLISREQYDMLLFLSPSAFKNFMAKAPETVSKYALNIASIGSTTTKEINKYGIRPLLTAEHPNIVNLVNSLEEYYIENNKLKTY